MLRQTKTAATRPHKTRLDCWRDSILGVALCMFIAAVSLGVQAIETRHFGHPYVEAIVVAILLGMAIRAVW